MKILDRYILQQFLISFFAAFFIILLIFVFHTIWLYIDEVAGKGLSIWIIIRFVLLMLPNMLPIILPLTVVLSSIVTLGTLAENYEFAAIKASGISLFRMIRSLIIFMFLLSIIVFFMTNNLQPMAYRDSYHLRRNIAAVQPSLALQEGVFTKIEDYFIKIGKKTGENGEFLHDITIHINEDGLNKTVIKAKEGELVGESKMNNTLQLILKDGTHYKEVTNAHSHRTFPATKTHFKKYTMNLDISSLNQEIDFNKKDDAENFRMMNVNELSYTLDSVRKVYTEAIVDYGESMHRRTGIYFLQERSTHAEEPTDTLRSMEELLSKFVEHDRKTQLIDIAKNNVRTMLSNSKFQNEEVDRWWQISRLYELTISDKFALAFTCFVLFFVAAPLGAFIRKGGIGMPMVVGMLLFLSYYFLGIFIKNASEHEIVNPYFAPWVPTCILLPLGFYLTYRVNKDLPLFPEEGLFKSIKDMCNKLLSVTLWKKKSS